MLSTYILYRAEVKTAQTGQSWLFMAFTCSSIKEGFKVCSLCRCSITTINSFFEPQSKLSTGYTPVTTREGKNTHIKPRMGDIRGKSDVIGPDRLIQTSTVSYQHPLRPNGTF